MEFPFYALRSYATTIYKSHGSICDGKTAEHTTLNELADLLNCSRRHMRTLLPYDAARGWLTWEAEVGREAFASPTFCMHRTGAATAAGGRCWNKIESIAS